MDAFRKCVLLTVFLVPYVTSFDCPDITECDCKRERERDSSSGNVKGYNVVECHGKLPQVTLNLTTLKHTTISKFVLKGSSLSRLNKEIFADLRVRNVVIEDTRLTIDDDAFLPINGTLRHLTLKNVGLDLREKLPFLKGLTGLKSLVLDYNGVYPQSLPEYAFGDLLNLESLSVRYCELTRMTDGAMEGLDKLESLDFSGNKLSNVPETILLLKNLRKLFLMYNKRLTFIHEYAFRTLDKLEELHLSHSKIDTITEQAFDGLEQSLRVLKLDHGNLEDGHFASIIDLAELRVLDLSYNKIVEMHNESFVGFIMLEDLDISGQYNIQGSAALRMNFIDSMFRGLEKKLKTLRIKDLGLESLPLGTLGRLTSLQVLDASKNKFTEIYESFFDGIRAKTIILTDMDIGPISNEAFDTMSEGMRLVFDRNNITNISFALEVKPCLFKKLSLVGNPVSCDCDVAEIEVTNRVAELVGTCADELNKGTKLNKLHELDDIKATCDIDGFKKKVLCTHINGVDGAPAKLTTHVYIAILLAGILSVRIL